MIKEEIKRCLEKNVEMWQKETNSLPKISYDEDVCEWSDLFVGQPDTDSSIQWQYAPVDRILDFSDLEKRYCVELPEDLKDFYNAYFFLELRGFIDNECISFKPLDETVDVLDNLEFFLGGEEDEESETTNFIVLGLYAHKYWFGISKFGKGQVVALLEEGKEYVLAESLGKLFKKLKIGSPQLGWYSVLTSAEQKHDDSGSFIGGKPCIPATILLPTCKICGDPLTFFFQVAFPKGHMWEGKSLALFFCDSTYYKHDAHDMLPPVLLRDEDDLSDNDLDPDHYQTLFRVFFFDTRDGVIREDYQEKVRYQRIDWKEGRRRDKKVPIILAGEPVWMESHWRERPRSCGGNRMEFVLQVADYFNFEIYPNALSEMEANYMALQGQPPFRPREENNYTLFCDFNRVFLWGTTDKQNPVFGINVQSDV